MKRKKKKEEAESDVCVTFGWKDWSGPSWNLLVFVSMHACSPWFCDALSVSVFASCSNTILLQVVKYEEHTAFVSVWLCVYADMYQMFFLFFFSSSSVLTVFNVLTAWDYFCCSQTTSLFPSKIFMCSSNEEIIFVCACRSSLQGPCCQVSLFQSMPI